MILNSFVLWLDAVYVGLWCNLQKDDLQKRWRQGNEKAFLDSGEQPFFES
jgi:hypothetical protein